MDSSFQRDRISGSIELASGGGHSGATTEPVYDLKAVSRFGVHRLLFPLSCQGSFGTCAEGDFHTNLRKRKYLRPESRPMKQSHLDEERGTSNYTDHVGDSFFQCQHVRANSHWETRRSQVGLHGSCSQVRCLVSRMYFQRASEFAS